MNFTIWFSVFSFSVLTFTSASTDALPTAEDINSLAEAANQVTETFMQESFGFRMQYEFSGRFLTGLDKAKLNNIAKIAGDRLLAIAQNQQKLKQQIEDYQGRDWDIRYGSTGLWRKLFGDLYTTRLSEFEIDFYLALTAQQAERNKILHKILAQIDALEQMHDAAYAQFLKARTLVLLAQTDPNYKPAAEKQFDALMERSDMRKSTAFRVEIERAEFLGLAEPKQLRKIAENIAKGKCADDLELVLSLAALQRRKDPNGFEKTVTLFPRAEGFLGLLILTDLSRQATQGRLDKQAFGQISVFEAEIATKTAWKDKAQDHKMLLEEFSRTEKFQTPLVLYVAAVAFADSSPAKAVSFLTKASKLQHLQRSDRLGIPAGEVAKQAAQLAYNSFAEDLLNCQLATKAFESYLTITQGRTDEELEYRYVTILNMCNLSEKAKMLLQKIADRDSGNWRNRAKLDLIMLAVLEKQHENQARRNKLLKQLSDLIKDCRGQAEENRQLRVEAMTICCQLLLESQNKIAAQKVLNILTDAETAAAPKLNVFKSKALQQLGRLGESADCLIKGMVPGNCEHALQAMRLLSEVTGEIDQLKERAGDFHKLVKDCEKIAQYCYGCAGSYQNGLYLAEVSIFAAGKEKGKLSAVDKMLDSLANYDPNDVNLLRCRARLLTEQSKFDDAAAMWAQIAGSESSSANQRSWKWWRAKFYELDCLAKSPQAEKESRHV